MGKQAVAGQPGESQIAVGKGGVGSRHVAVHDKALGLVQGDPPGHPVGEGLHNRPDIVPKQGNDPIAEPAALFLHPHRKVPVVQRYQRLDAVFQKLVHQVGVEGQAPGVDRPLSGHDPGPGDGKAVALQPHFLHQGHVLFPAVIVVAGGVAVGAALDFAGGGRVPYGRRFAALVPAPLDLSRGRGRAPEKVFRKRHVHSSHSIVYITMSLVPRAQVRSVFPPSTVKAAFSLTSRERALTSSTSAGVRFSGLPISRQRRLGLQ